ncbi:MAG: BglII/BstYI family type II restriction endonuclease [Rhodobacteraceae bacterium]|nr:BglII/BstYI family type II restriction endonuclease [Paracoccaceae bacterium]MCY4249505.1 BglII/BstYI family type II restriction endonuclease [Paracoccaceae bacterium]MCY4308331.1 BglII/BstYI family type II restriction endonuclease [Paracoccaceae bacterium]
MKIVEKYSHLNGEEYLIVHKPKLRREVQDTIQKVNAEEYRTKISKERTKLGEILYSPKDMNKAFKDGFERLSWKERRNTFWVTSDAKLLSDIYRLHDKNQKKEIEAKGLIPIKSSNQTDFFKERVVIEVQFGKYPFVAYDLFVKHPSFFTSGIIDVGIEILPIKELQSMMSSGISYYEREILNVIRQGRGVPAVPLILIGVEP